jgi:hypothetical protein
MAVVPPDPDIDPGTAPAGGSYVGRFGIVVFSLFVSALTAFALLLLIQLWPVQTGGKKAGYQLQHVVLGVHVHPALEIVLMLIALLSGLLGAMIHSLRSISNYVGNRSLRWSWMLYYATLPFVGASLALVFYFVFRAGLISTQANAQAVSPYGVAAISGLVGLFSNQAAEMLKNVFSSIFTKAPRGSDSTPASSNPGGDHPGGAAK